MHKKPSTFGLKLGNAWMLSSLTVPFEVNSSYIIYILLLYILLSSALSWRPCLNGACLNHV